MNIKNIISKQSAQYLIGTVIISILGLVLSETVLGSGGGSRRPPPPPPVDFACGWAPVNYVERLPQNINGMNVSISVRGLHAISGRTRHGSHSCAAIRDAINRRDTSSWAFPSRVTSEQLVRQNWNFNHITLVRDGNNVKSSPPTITPPPGTDVQGATVSSGYTQYNTVVQRSAPSQSRSGGIFRYSFPINNGGGGRPTFLSGMYPVSHAPLLLGLNYRFTHVRTYQVSTTCQSTGPSWRECNRNMGIEYRPEVLGTDIRANSFRVEHRDRPFQQIYPNSPIRMGWTVEYPASATCNISTPGAAALSQSNINYDPNVQGLNPSVVYTPFDEARDFYQNQVATNAEYVTNLVSQIAPGNYTSTLTCNFRGNLAYDDRFKTYPPGDGSVTRSQATSFSVADAPPILIEAEAIPRTLDNSRIQTRIRAYTSVVAPGTPGARPGDPHTYRIQALPKGFSLASGFNTQIVANAQANGSSNVEWVVDLDPAVADVGTVEVVVEMEDLTGNIHAVPVPITYLGSRQFNEISPTE